MIQRDYGTWGNMVKKMNMVQRKINMVHAEMWHRGNYGTKDEYGTKKS
jgi:hypothetical protein